MGTDMLAVAIAKKQGAAGRAFSISSAKDAFPMRGEPKAIRLGMPFVPPQPLP